MTTQILNWRPTNAPIASSRTDDVFFLDPLVGWAVNSNGTIVHTTDGFETHQVQFQDNPPLGGEPIYFRCLAFSSPTRGWAGTLTPGNRLFETSNGSTWAQVANLPGQAPSAICGIYAVNGQVVYGSGTNYPNRPAAMIKTTDGGLSWSAWSMEPWADLLVDCFFTSPSRGWVVGGKVMQPPATRNNVKPVVLLTEDGGQTWVNRVADLQGQFPLGEWGWKIQFLNDQVGFVSLENFTAGAILKTTDGGQTWTRLPINDPQQNANLEGVGFVDELHGWVGGWGDIDFQRKSSSETVDGGLTWRDANEIGTAINRFRFFGNPVTVGYSSGLTVYKYSAAPISAALEARAAAPARGKYFDSLEILKANGAVRVPIMVPKNSKRLAAWIWDRFGELVHTLVDETDPKPGERVLEWDRRDRSGNTVPPGTFICRVTIDGNSESRIISAT